MLNSTSPRLTADRNLLFGVLALQMDFISRDALVAAMHAWVLDKARPLGQILVGQGALREDAQQLLEALVQKHVEIHGSDLQKSLASVSSLGPVHQDLGKIADPDLHDSLASVSVAAPLDEEFNATRGEARVETDPFDTQPHSPGTPTSSGVRFRVLRPHAKGGLGEVFVALDTELGREVALKEIQVRHAHDLESRSRFVREAEITAGLEHPGIVPVYGLGTYLDGRPYYAMRFIRGDSLQDAVRRFHQAEKEGPDPGERALELRHLLGRFVDVCNAIAYAHSRGILHRDLKPGNVMLGRYGETLVVDWGLAKPVGRPEGGSGSAEGTLRPSSSDDSTPTQMGSALGTPAYMSPEQAAGRLDLLGPASDVYSLGATLYSLLTGKPPFKGDDLGGMLQQVRNGEFQRPRHIKKDVPPALEAICLKAMALRPEDRYASAEDVAGEVDHWLADEPVSAWSEPWPLKARRWVRRHQTWVTAAGAAIMVALVSLGVAAVLLTQANGLLRQAKDEEEKAKDLAVRREREAYEQRDLAVANLREAEEQRDRAHFYLESMIDMNRFGRSLKSHPLRKDFGLRIRLVNGTRGVKTRGMIARGDFDTEQAFYLSVESTADCFLYVFYAVPASAILGRERLDPILEVFPNRVEHDNRMPMSTKRLLLNEEGLFLSPVVTSGDFAYLYVLAAEKDSQFTPDGACQGFSSFSPKAATKLARQISEIVEGEGGSTPADQGKVAEEILVFNVRSEGK